MAGPEAAARPPEEPDDPTAPQRARYGLALFVCYVVVYGGFVLLNAFAPSAMERTPLAGVNLAVLLGLGLIAAAFGLALVYEWLCRGLAARSHDGPEEPR
jgi:uncharacterized membrane protein (DUF485 family)